MVRTNLGYKYYNIYASFKELQPNDDSTTKMITPSQIGKLGNPINKEYNSEDEVVPIYKVFANSIYKKINADQVEESFDAQNILTDENFWCSAGLHGLKEEVIFNIEFNRSYRINAMWIQWAFGPGKFQINYSNDDTFGDNKKWIKLREMTDSFPERDIVWWKSILSNPKNRWKYRSFDNRVDFQEPVWAKYIQIIMTIPVNQYYGIYKVEVYTKTKSIVMIRSKTPGENLCLSTINGQMTDYSPVIAIDCLQAIGYGDNRDLLIINSNGYITTLKGNKCVESPNTNSVNIIECGTAATFKDEREKWILDYDGKIRSSKEPYSCLTIEDESFEDYVPNEFIRVKASSQLNDNIHEPIKVLDYDNKSYWSSSLTNTVVK